MLDQDGLHDTGGPRRNISELSSGTSALQASNKIDPLQSITVGEDIFGQTVGGQSTWS